MKLENKVNVSIVRRIDLNAKSGSFIAGILVFNLWGLLSEYTQGRQMSYCIQGVLGYLHLLLCLCPYQSAPLKISTLSVAIPSASIKSLCREFYGSRSFHYQ